MHSVIVTFFIKKENVEDFMKASFDNATNSRKEAGNVRYDILRSNDDETKFFFYEVYKTYDDFLTHQKSEHYLRWEKTVTDWMAQPFQIAMNSPVFFGESQC